METKKTFVIDATSVQMLRRLFTEKADSKGNVSHKYDSFFPATQFRKRLKDVGAVCRFEKGIPEDDKAVLVVGEYERLSREKIPAILVYKFRAGESASLPTTLGFVYKGYCKSYPGYYDLTPITGDGVVVNITSYSSSGRVWRRLLIAVKGTKFRDYSHGMRRLLKDEVGDV